MSSRPSRNNRAAANRFRPCLEALEQREVPAKLIVLDFDGVSRSDVEILRDRRVSNNLTDLLDEPGFEGTQSFVGVFAALHTMDGGYDRFRFLDLDRNRRLDIHDGDLAADRIMACVREAYASYDVDVVRQDDTWLAVDRLMVNRAHDALIHLSGAHDMDAIGGQAPFDPGNLRDDAGTVGTAVGLARRIADRLDTDEVKVARFVNQFANLVSHEAGHTFGLKHIAGYEAPAWGTSIMTPSVGAGNLTFADVHYDTGDGTSQNEHQYLTSVLGASAKPWAAVLKPGTLTVKGSDVADRVHIFNAGQDVWVVRISTGSPHNFEDSYQVDSSAFPHVHAMNPFQSRIQTIDVRLRDGNDFLWVDPSIRTVSVKARGGGGNDTMSGGGISDLLFGERGDDRLFGQGLDDDLRGGDGRDVLVGGDGGDTLRGGSGKDLLIGSRDHDTLHGDGDADLLIAGHTNFDTDTSVLGDLLAEWSSSRGYETRIANLRGSGTGPRANGSTFLIARGGGATVFDDGIKDDLFGSGSRDWFFGHFDEDDDLNEIKDKASNEFVDELGGFSEL